jgi:WD40 repeat protein
MFSINKIVKSRRYNKKDRENKFLSGPSEQSSLTIILNNVALLAGVLTILGYATSFEALAAQNQLIENPANKVCKQLFFDQYQKYEISLDEITSSATVDLPIDSTSKLAGLDEYRYQTNRQYDRNPKSPYQRELGTADQTLKLPRGTNSVMPNQAFKDLGHYRESQLHNYSRTIVEKQLGEVKYLKSQACFPFSVLDARQIEDKDGEKTWMLVLKNGDVESCPAPLGTGMCSVIAHIDQSTIELASIAPSGSKVGFAGGGEFGFFDIDTAETFSDDHVGGKFMALTWSSPQDGEIRQGEQFLVAAADGDIFLFNPRASDVRKRIEKYAGHSSVPSALAFLPDGTVFISGDWQGALAATQLYSEEAMSATEYQKDYMRGRVFEMKATRKLASRKGSESISAFAMVPGGEHFIAGGVNGSVELWEVKGFAQSDVKKQSSAEVLGAVVDDGGSVVATLNRKGLIDVWKIEDGEVVLGIQGKKRISFKKEIAGSGIKRLLSVDEKGAVMGLSEEGCAIIKK